MRGQVLEHSPLDKHEASAAVTHLDAAALVCLGVSFAYHIKHKGSGVVPQPLLACGRSALHTVPVHLFLGVDTADDILVRQH